MEKFNELKGWRHEMNRRSFLKLSGLLGLGAASIGIAPVKSEAVRFNKKLFKVSRTSLAMGTFVSMTLVHPSRDQAEEAMGLAFSEIDRLAKLLSRYDDTTAVGQLNKEGYLKDVPPEIHVVVTRALTHYRKTRGAFDITVKPIVDLFKEKFKGRKKTAPTPAEMEQALALIGANKIEVKGGSIRFKQPGMGITLDGIGKGFIVDQASALLSRKKIDNYLVNAGGDIRTRGTRADRKPWKVAIQDPSLKGKNYPDIVRMTDGAVATSGNYEIYFDHEKMFHHIVNPGSGLSPKLSSSVSVLAETTMEADALSTSVFVMEPDHGTAFINSLENCEALVITHEGTHVKSRGWKS